MIKTDFFNRQQEILNGLVGEVIDVTFTNGHTVTARLQEVLPDALIVENHKSPGKNGILAGATICFILTHVGDEEEAEWPLDA